MIGILILTLTAFICSILIIYVDIKTASKEENNNLKEKFLTLLPGLNCGMCGYPGCRAMADAMMEDVLNYQKCKPLRGEKRNKMENYIEELRASKTI
ncbi:MAG TPA: hypothetical protein GX747_05095 [Tenericutes bacterium]|nr:hypothetical protein [Mycoplasmatota bacterium]